MNQKRPREGRSASGPACLLPGYKDQLPNDARVWQYILQSLEGLAQDYGFTRIATPIVEDARLYTGRAAVLPQEQLVQFAEDSEGAPVILRPENLIPLARAYREHGFMNLPQPMKLWYSGPQFRREEKTGHGTYRQFTQFGVETFGDPQPVVDAQLIAALFFLLQEFHLDVRLVLNSLGHAECRAAYEKQLLEFFRTRRAALCEACRAKLTRQPISVFACTQPGCVETSAEAPPIVDFLCAPDRDHFVRVLEHLDEVEVAYELDPRLFRPTHYANRTVCEFRILSEGHPPIILARAGRHDQLLGLVGAPPAPAFGWVCGVERIALAMRENGVLPPPAPSPDLFLAHLGDAARRKSLQLFLKLRTEGLHIAESLSQDGIKAQLERAAEQHAKFALILGQKEIMDGTILIRDMENGIQEVIDLQKVIPEVKKRLTKMQLEQQPTQTASFAGQTPAEPAEPPVP